MRLVMCAIDFNRYFVVSTSFVVQSVYKIGKEFLVSVHVCRGVKYLIISRNFN